MDEDVKTLSDYAVIGWRRKYYILIPFALLLAITILTLILLPPVYRSTGTVLIESQQIPRELIQSTVTSFADERIQIIRQRIMTSQQLLSIIKKFNLYEDDIDSRPRSEILDDLRDRISIDKVSANVKSRRRGASALIAFTISFEHQSATVAQRVANELVTLFLDENIRSRTARAEETSDFLKQESNRLRSEIEGMEEEIAVYKQENEGRLPEGLQLNLEQVVTLNATMMTTDNELFEMIESRRLLLVEFNALKASTMTDTETQDQVNERRELTALQNQFIGLSARYGSEHPDVKAIKRQIAAFEQEYGNLVDIDELKSQQQFVRSEMLELTKKYSPEHPDVKKLRRKLDGITEMIADSPAATVSTDTKSVNPEVMKLQVRLESIDKGISRLRNTRADQRALIDQLETKISQTPQVERGLDVLERDYANTRRKYEEIKAKQLQAELSKSLEEEQKGERFTLLEPPLSPDRPVKPNRPKLFVLGLILSFAGGLGVASIAESLDGGIRGARALAMATKLTPLVTIPYISVPSDLIRRKQRVKLTLLGLLLLTVAVIATIHFFYKPLDLLWFILLQKISLT